MKSIFITLFTFTLSFVHATVITVDNTAGSAANYSTVANAITNSVSGDTLYIHPSLTNYGDFIVNKQLVILGPGHHGGWNNVNSRVRIISLATGSSGTYIGGVEVSSIQVPIFNVASTITIENNLFTGAQAIFGVSSDNGNASNWIIRGNIFDPQGGCGGCKAIDQRTGSSQLGPNINWVINNNIFHSATPCCGGTPTTFANLNASSVVTNNTLVIKSTSLVFESTLTNNDAVFINNIFIVTGTETDIAASCVNCVFDNNLTFSASATLTDLPGLTNFNNQEPTFVNVPNYTWDISHDYLLNGGSPGVNGGTDGTDIGVNGGTYNFTKYGYPPGVPVTEGFTILTPVIVEGEDVIINLKAKIAN
jgi:hypothetical protein